VILFPLASAPRAPLDPPQDYGAVFLSEFTPPWLATFLASALPDRFGSIRTFASRLHSRFLFLFEGMVFFLAHLGRFSVFFETAWFPSFPQIHP